MSGFIKPCLAYLILSLAAAPAPSAEWSWTFDTDSEGWQIADLQSYGPYHPPLAEYSLSQSSAGGCDGGHVYRPDPSSNTYTFSMPIADLPEGLQLSGGRLEFCLRSTHQTWTSESFVIFAGVAEILLAPIPVPSATWSSYVLDLLPGEMTRMDGAPVDSLLFEAVMSHLEAVYIMAEYGSTSVETSYLDSVRLRTACVPLEAPQVTAELTGLPDQQELRLSWLAVAGAHSYEVYRLDTPWGGGLSQGTTTSLEWGVGIDGMPEGFYQVRARCD